MKDIPFYLHEKLFAIGIERKDQICDNNYLTIFAKLKANFSSISYQALYDLYCYVFTQTFPDHSTQKELVQQYKRLPPHHNDLPQSVINHYMFEATKLANIAFEQDEIPIGAVIVYQNKIIGKGYNQTKMNNNILSHAEIIAIEQAQKQLRNHRLSECDLYVTIEPCLMCSGAIINSRIKRVIFGACEPKTGAIKSQYHIFDNIKVNHHTEVIGPIDQTQTALVQRFLCEKRNYK